MATSIKKFEVSGERPQRRLQTIDWQVSVHSYVWSPPTDIYETDAGFIVRVEVAGMCQSDFSINIDKHYLVISGTRNETSGKRAYRQMEIRFGEFSTAVELPSGVDIEKAEAKYEDGFLVVILPKMKPAEIQIRDNKK